jgi:hypothetical protein
MQLPGSAVQSPAGTNTPSFLAKDGELEYNTTILQDQFIRLKFTK